MHRPTASSARLALVVALLLAPTLAQGLHAHGGPAEAPRAKAGCDDARPHLASHPDAPDLCHPTDDCPACHFRIGFVAEPDAGPRAEPLPATGLVEYLLPAVRSGQTLPPPSRGPPVA